jgi:hypothetical protein
MTDYSYDTLQDLAAQLDKLQDQLERATDAAATIPGLIEHISEIKKEMRIRLDPPYPSEPPSADPAEDGEELTEDGIEQRFEAETQAVRAIIETELPEVGPDDPAYVSFAAPQTD